MSSLTAIGQISCEIGEVSRRSRSDLCEPTAQPALTLIAKNKVLVGTSRGRRRGVRFRESQAACDAQTGKEAWRFWTIPAAPLGGLLWLAGPPERTSSTRFSQQRQEKASVPCQTGSISSIQMHSNKRLQARVPR